MLAYTNGIGNLRHPVSDGIYIGRAEADTRGVQYTIAAPALAFAIDKLHDSGHTIDPA